MQSINGMEIAIIGMSGRFSLANSINEFLQLLTDGKDGVSEISIEELKDLKVSDELLKNPNYVRRRGVFHEKKYFDAELFKYTSKEASLLDPQFCILHECVWEALEHSGYESQKYSGLIGIFAGSSNHTASINRVTTESDDMAGLLIGQSLCKSEFLTSRVAYKLNLRGPAINVQTTCSTSLTAIHLASQSLNLGECDIALAGGVSVGSLKNYGYLYQKDMIASSDGFNRTFDAKASGTVGGEGCGILVLKRLEDALEDRDNILAIIKGSAVNNDGHQKVGYYSPSVEGQMRVIRTAHQRAGVTPESITYVEAHGTATKLGDPIEVQALIEAFSSKKKGFCKIGSVKSNIGHLAEAAGAAGMIKTILSLHCKKIFPSIHYKTPNLNIDFENSPFRVSTELTNWDNGNELRRAGVSSFGMGGTNVHVILEEASIGIDRNISSDRNMVFLSANSATALDNITKNLADYVSKNKNVSIADLCYTLHVGRKDLPYRKSFVVESFNVLVDKLNGASNDKIFMNKVETIQREICFLFPGQGSQYINMGKDLYEKEPYFRYLLDKCFLIAENASKVNYKNCLFPSNENSGSALDISETYITQPLIFFIEYSLAKFLIKWNVIPNSLMGHSIGEYVAACISGVFSLEDAIFIVIQRGKLIQKLSSGSMLRVTLSEEEIAPLMNDDICLAAINGPRHLVVSGDNSAILLLQGKLNKNGVSNSILSTSHAFHSKHMDPILSEFSNLLSSINLSSPKIPFISNVTGIWIEERQATSPDYWSRQLRQSVQFRKGINFLCKLKNQVFLEIGPGKALSTFVLQNIQSPSRHICIPLMQTKHRSSSDLNYFQEGLCQMFLYEITPDWDEYYFNETRGRISLPTYPFEKKCYYENIDCTNKLELSSESNNGLAEKQRDFSSVCETDSRSENIDRHVDHSETVRDKLEKIWARYLGVSNIGLQDNLFSLGVDSLLSIRVITNIRDTFNVEFSIEDMFKLTTIYEQAKAITTKKDKGSNLLPPIVPVQHGGVAPLSSSQKRLWFISQLEEDISAYNTGIVLTIDDLCIESLNRTFDTVFLRHSILRTTYFLDGKNIRQKILKEYNFLITQICVAKYSTKEKNNKIKNIFSENVLMKFDLTKDLMLRACLIKLSDKRHYLLIVQHHITTDNWSYNILRNEIIQLYNAFKMNEDNPLHPLEIQYIDYAIWENSWLKDSIIQKEVRYWKEKLEGIPLVHNLPLDKNRPKRQSYRGAKISKLVEKDILEKLTFLAQSSGATLFMTLQAAFSVLISRYSGVTDIVIGFQVANRMHKQLESIVGFFVNTIVLRSNLSGNPVFLDLLENTKENLVSAYSHQNLPFEMLVEALGPDRSLGYEPIVQIQIVMLDLDPSRAGHDLESTVTLSGLNSSEIEGMLLYSKYDLTLYITETPDGLATSWEYASDLFDKQTIERMALSFSTLLQGIVTDPNRSISVLSILSDAEQKKQMMEWVNLKSDFPYSTPSQDRGNSLQNATNELTSSLQELNFSLFYFANDRGNKCIDKYWLLLEGAKFADSHEFEAIWTPERHFDTFGGLYPNPAITAAAIASITKNIKIRAGSCVLPLHSPVRVAEDWSVIDNLSGGRAGIGVAAGFHPNDFTIAPDNYSGRHEKLIKDIQLVKSLWRGDSVTLKNGVGEMAEIKIRPRPIQNELPLWVTTTGNPDAFHRAGCEGSNVLTHIMGQSIDELAKKVEIYRRAWIASGHSGEGRVTVLIHTFISNDQNYVLSNVKEPFKKYISESLGSQESLKKHFDIEFNPNKVNEFSNDFNAIMEVAFRRYYESSALLGTPQRCLPLVKSIKNAGVNEIACLIDFGVDPSIVLENLYHLNELRLLSLKKVERNIYKYTEDEPFSKKDKCIHEVFEDQVKNTPDTVAVVFGDQRLTYSELDKKSDRLARYLVEQGLTSEIRVGLLIERSLEVVVAIMGILKAGGVYVPIDPSCPQQRIGYILIDSGIVFVLTESRFLGKFSVLSDNDVKLITLDKVQFIPESKRKVSKLPNAEIKPQNLAYIIYTSGSTGNAKGVMISHQSVVNTLRFLESTYPVRKGDSYLLKTNYMFDVSITELFGWFFGSGHLVILPPKLEVDPDKMINYIDKHQITHINFVPSALGVFLNIMEQRQSFIDGCSLKYVMVAGEIFSKNLVKRAVKMFRKSAVENLYGPTEATIYCSFFSCSNASIHNSTSIGKALPNTALYILDTNLQMLPIGVVGELCIAGLGVAKGYVNQQSLNAKLFIDNPYNKEYKIYKTGDFARWLPDGNIEYIGRIDHQIKIRGYRVELAEVENAISQQPYIHDTVVTVISRSQPTESGCLVAYVASDKHIQIDQAALRSTLLSILPEYMVPRLYVFLDELPLTISGKIDRDALPAPDEGSILIQEYVEPRTGTEKSLASIWANVLQLREDVIGIHDSFFDLGGDSILAFFAASQANRQGIHIKISQFFEYQILEELANCAQQELDYNVDQSHSKGEQLLSPIQYWLFTNNEQYADHFLQSYILKIPIGFDTDFLHDFVETLYQRHDVLRLRFSFSVNSKRWTAFYSPLSKSLLKESVIIESLENENNNDMKSLLSMRGEKIKSSFNIQSGPLMKMVYFKATKVENSRLLWITNHLIVDPLTWGILFEDLLLAFKQWQCNNPLVLPPKTHSYKLWGSTLQSLSGSENFSKEKKYWLSMLSPVPPFLEYECKVKSNKVGDTGLVSFKLDRDDTNTLLFASKKGHYDRINYFLLSGLLLAFFRWKKISALLIYMESHDRKNTFGDVNLTQTLGWFTSLYPLRLSFSRLFKVDSQIGDLIKSIKEQIHKIPHNGIGYGILRYLAENKALIEAEKEITNTVVFNYLGKLTQQFDQEQGFGLAKEDTGIDMHSNLQRIGTLGFTFNIIEDCLNVTLDYNRLQYHQKTAEDLSKLYKNALKDIISHIQDPDGFVD